MAGANHDDVELFGELHEIGRRVPQKIVARVTSFILATWRVL
jgi:hypothetical protein